MASARHTFASAIFDNVENVIVSKRTQMELILVAMLCQGYLLLEDVPGTGKIMLARSITMSMGTERIRAAIAPRATGGVRPRPVQFGAG